MRAEKQFLVDELSEHLGKSDYVFLADYNRMTVAETAELREKLEPHGAEFHVVKNRLFNVAAEAAEYPELGEMLAGPTGIIVGGDDIAKIVKVIEAFYKDKDKLVVKGGVLSKQVVDADGVSRLKDLPTKEQLQAQLLALLNTPGTQLVRLFNTVPEQMVTVLSAVPRDILSVLQQRSQQEN